MSTVPVVKRRRDWFRILRDLAAVGVSYAAVGRVCQRSTTTVQAWAEGAEPKESDARIVLALYAKHLPESYAEHQRHFDIRVAVESLEQPGEQRTLRFVEVR
jgi:hypothetical protein